ncbi:hypothetical protein Tsubulata_045655 [Turnera subulata]|uniref:Uncharacterized protein n=1 Tax=Turnera subulata TaxID=218843 RepID=A0A9Q0JPR9_9ROSI|nr:hypothetical protein Tsubulata_045655 [Turnera subulata]
MCHAYVPARPTTLACPGKGSILTVVDAVESQTATDITDPSRERKMIGKRERESESIKKGKKEKGAQRVVIICCPLVKKTMGSILLHGLLFL